MAPSAPKAVPTPTGWLIVLTEGDEMTGINGTLALKEGKPSVHADGVGCGSDFGVVGGHPLALTVGRGSLEVTVTAHDRQLERRQNPTIGANILRL